MKKKHLIRDNFRNEVFGRDGYKCRVCGRNDVELDAHHITNRNLISNGGYIKENGITLCDVEDGCHIKAEMGILKEDELYKLINSSKELAIKKSEEL